MNESNASTATTPSTPETQPTLVESIDRLKAVLPETFCVEAIVWFHRFDNGTELDIAFSVWDGKVHYKAPTLAEAVNMALRAHTRPPTPDMAAAEAAFSQASQLQEFE